jgi:YVTN family beta-propeller protein
MPTTNMGRRFGAALLFSLLPASALPLRAQPITSTPYSIYVSSEAADIVSRIAVDAEGWHVEREVSVKLVPNEISGPHNVAVSRDGRFWYVSISHGTPNGSIWKYDAQNDSLLARVSVGMFPTTIALSPQGGAWAWIPNSDFHGDRGHLNTVSALYTPTMEVIAAVETCDMPHGSKWNARGTVVYIACMMSDELVTIDPGSFAIAKRVLLGSGTPMTMAQHEAHQAGAASSTKAGQNPDCLATYVSVSPDDKVVYVACNHSGELQVREAGTLNLIKRVPTGAGAYNVEPSANGKYVVVTNKKAQSVTIVDAQTLNALATIATSKPIPHGVAFSPDGNYVFITCESKGTDPGALDAIDLRTLKRVATLPLPIQPTGVAVRAAR